MKSTISISDVNKDASLFSNILSSQRGGGKGKLGDVPVEVMTHVLSFIAMTPMNLVRISSLKKDWYQHFSQDVFWKSVLHETCPQSKDRVKKNMKYAYICVRAYRVMHLPSAEFLKEQVKRDLSLIITGHGGVGKSS